jgi:hypothetical protein
MLRKSQSRVGCTAAPTKRNTNMIPTKADLPNSRSDLLTTRRAEESEAATEAKIEASGNAELETQPARDNGVH